MDISSEELDARISELQTTLEQSQCANRNPEQYSDYNRLSAKEHFEMWDDMWKLVCERKEMKSVGS